MDEDVKDERYIELGFRPQKENVYNKLLPYAADIDEESTKLFADIKTNLAKSVLAREMRPGCALWTSRLNKYIKIYGMKFSKDDHIALVKLYYELLTIPDLEPTRINKSALTLNLLLKKKYLLTRDELQLEWRPLYELCVRVIEKSKVVIGMYRYFSSFEPTLFNVIRACKVYFPASATQEILDEFRPKLCPFNVPEISNAVQYLELFLPYAMKPEEADISYKLWFKEFMDLWDVCHNASSWENNMMWIMSGIARFQIGYIDWEPYIPSMFTRFLRALPLPVNFKQRQLGINHKIDTTAMAMWIVCVLHGDANSAFFQFEKFMQTLETYFHPANFGRWTERLRELLRKLSYLFVQRVHCERYKTPSWEFNVPDDQKLTDEDIDRFVKVMKPCLEPAMFSRMGSQDVSLALQYLASLRPNIIVPMTLEKLYASMDSLTEPHKLTSSMIGVMAVGRYMVQGRRNGYPEGPTHVIPLLMALLPGIDPNDIRKSYVTCNFIMHFVNMVPVVNSADAFNFHDLTEEEHIVCEASAGFEDFVLQFFDRLCVWVESSSLDFVRLEQMTNNLSLKNKTDTLSESALANVITVVLYQCSPEIFKAALKKFYNFATSKVLEIQIAGKMVATAGHCFTRVNPQETLKLFIPHLCNRIEELLDENPHIETEEHIDDELLYNLLLLSEIVGGKSELLDYIDRVTAILDRTIGMTCLKSNQITAKMLGLMISSLSNIQPKEMRSCPVEYTIPTKDFLPVREWGKAQNVKDLKISWYVPGEKEIDAVQKLLNKYLVPELEKLDKHSSGERNLTRQELKRVLGIVTSVLSCQPLLPIWDEDSYQLVDSVLEPWAFNLKVSPSGTVNMPDGRNIRKVIVDCMHRLQKKILEIDEGDTKSIQCIINIYNIILFNRTRGVDFEIHWRTFHMAKKILEDRLHQKKLHLRHLLIERVMLQQEFRIESRNCTFTKTHKQVMLDLLELSVSRYSEVRIAAQSKLFSMISYFPYSYNVLTPKLKEYLQLDSTQYHEQFKGCLYILLGPKSSPIIARHDWEFIKELWPLLVRSTPSEKPSIVNLISALTDTVHKFFPTIAIKLCIPDSVLNAARFWINHGHPVLDLSDFQKHIDFGVDYLQEKSQLKRLAYENTLNSLLEACEKGNLHWRYFSMAVSFLKDLVHYDVKYNSKIVRFFLYATINESLVIRKNAIRLLIFITIQNKPQFKKIQIDPCGKNSNDKLVVPGEREDNEWLLYDSKTAPKTSEEWEKPRFLHDQVTGFYCWPKKLEVYAPASQQPSAAKRLDELTATEKELYDFFTNTKNVDQLIKYLSLEEKKGQDRFSSYRFLAFKNLFKIFEDELLPVFLPHIQKLLNEKQESSKRCAAEIISGMIRGSKHWSFDKVQNMWTKVLPLLDTAIVNMCNETQTDWALCITLAVESRDPNTCHWLLEFLMEDPLRDPTSYVACSRLHMLSALTQQTTWRNVEVYSRMGEYFKAHLAHPFQNIREKISLFLMIIYGKDLVFPGGNRTRGPRIEELFEEISPRLEALERYMLSKGMNGVDIESTSVSDVVGYSEEHKEEALRLFKVVAKYLTISMHRVNFSARAEFFKLLPLAVLLHNYDNDEETATNATNLLIALAQTMTIEKYIPCALEAIKRVVKCPLWSARAVITDLLPVFVFYNMGIVISNDEWVREIESMVLELLEDVQPEVRVGAAKVLSSLLHCEFIPDQMKLLDDFKSKAQLNKVRRRSQHKLKEYANNSKIRVRHGAVLGLCAFVNAHPYDVPDYLPEIFEKLGPHLSDPEPIPATIRKTMGDFKRTHHDNWECHKLKFTEEELSILSDLTVPPSYYV